MRASEARNRAVAAADAAERAARDEARAMAVADADAAAAQAAAQARKREQAEKASLSATAFLHDLRNMRFGKELLTVYSPEYIPPTRCVTAERPSR
jgi:hypothetical protein